MPKKAERDSKGRIIPRRVKRVNGTRLKRIALRLRDFYGYSDIEVSNLVGSFRDLGVAVTSDLMRKMRGRRRRVLETAADFGISFNRAREVYATQFAKHEVVTVWDVFYDESP